MRQIIIALFLTISFTGMAQQYTLKECIEIALQNNRTIKQQELNRVQRKIAYTQARNDLLPSLNAQAGQNFIFGRSIGLDNIYQNTNSAQTSFGLGADITLLTDCV